MKKWGVTGLVVVVLVALALTVRRWLPVLLPVLDAQTGRIQGLANAVQLLLWSVAGILLILRLWRGRREASPPQPAPQVAQPVTEVHVSGSGAAAVGEGAVAAGGGGVAVGRDNFGTIIIGGREEVRATEAALRADYLNWVIQETGYLSLEGIDPDVAGPDRETRLNLDSVYTALLVLPSGEEERLRKRRGEPELFADPIERRVPALAQLNRHPRLVLLGDPGSGKSTFVNFVALCLAGEGLGHQGVNLDLLTSPLPYQERQPWDHGPLLTVRVVLRDLAARGLPAKGTRPKARHLWEFIHAQLEEAKLGQFAPYLEKELHDKGGLILLDGLDEVPEAQDHREQIRDIVESFVGGFGKCRVLLTSRTYAYQSQDWRLRGFPEAVLAPFTREQIDHFVTLWYTHAARQRKLKEAAGRAEILKRAIFGNPRLRELAERPLLLTLMASLHAWRGGTLPERREELYDDALELLLNHWERQRVRVDESGNVHVLEPSLAEWLAVDQKKVRQVLEELAFEAHARQPEATGTADIQVEALVGALMRVSRNRSIQYGELVEYLCHRAGLLIERGNGIYTFLHRTFQEYLAACHLTGGESYPDRIAELAREDPNRWREVALLAGAKAARGVASSLWLLADHLCLTEPEGSAAAADLWGAHLAGQAVAESADLERLSPVNQKKLQKLQWWHVRLIGASDGLPATERALAGKTLARLGDPRFDPELWFLPKEPRLGFVEIPAGPFLMGSKKGDPQAPDSEMPQHEVTLAAFYMARYPVTVAQFRAFVEASGYEPRVQSSLEGISNHPVVYVTWHDALAYCRWLGERLREVAPQREVAGESLEHRSFWEALGAGGLTASLPSEAEWEKAGRGVDGRIYPWGDKPDANRASYDETKLGEASTVGCFPGGMSPYGCEEMSGNAWEWTRSLWRGYPYQTGIDRENLAASDGVFRVLHGGSFGNAWSSVRCAARLWGEPVGWRWSIGFRVVLLPFSSGL